MARPPRPGRRPTFQEILAECRQRCDRNLFQTAQVASGLGRLVDHGRATVDADHTRCPGLLSIGIPGLGRLHSHERWMEAATWSR